MRRSNENWKTEILSTFHLPLKSFLPPSRIQNKIEKRLFQSLPMRTLSCTHSYNIRSSIFHTVWWTDHLDWQQFSPVGQSPPWVCSESSNTDKNRLNEKEEKKRSLSVDCLVGSRRALWTSHLISLALSLPASLQSDAQIHFMLLFCKSLEVPDLQNAPGQTSQPAAINHFMSIKCTGTLFFF